MPHSFRALYGETTECNCPRPDRTLTGISPAITMRMLWNSMNPMEDFSRIQESSESPNSFWNPSMIRPSPDCRKNAASSLSSRRCFSCLPEALSAIVSISSMSPSIVVVSSSASYVRTQSFRARLADCLTRPSSSVTASSKNPQTTSV